MTGRKGDDTAPVCLWNLANGKCTKGNECRFSHADVSLTGDQKKALQTELPLFYRPRPKSKASKSPSVPPPKGDSKDKPCKFGVNCNKWKNGDKCAFTHT